MMKYVHSEIAQMIYSGLSTPKMPTYVFFFALFQSLKRLLSGLKPCKSNDGVLKIAQIFFLMTNISGDRCWVAILLAYILVHCKCVWMTGVEYTVIKSLFLS